MSSPYQEPGLNGQAPVPEQSQAHQLYADRRVADGTAPAVNPVRWSGRKTAIAAALALGLGGVTAGVAAAADPAHESQGRGPGMHHGGQFPGPPGMGGAPNSAGQPGTGQNGQQPPGGQGHMNQGQQNQGQQSQGGAGAPAGTH